MRGEAGRYISIHPLSNRESAREHGWGSEHPISVLSRGGSLLPSIYADARYVDDVIVSQADCTLHTGPTEGVNVYKNLDTEPTQVVITFVDGITVDQTGSYCSNWVQSEQQAAGVSSAPEACGRHCLDVHGSVYFSWWGESSGYSMNRCQCVAQASCVYTEYTPPAGTVDRAIGASLIPNARGQDNVAFEFCAPCAVNGAHFEYALPGSTSFITDDTFGGTCLNGTWTSGFWLPGEGSDGYTQRFGIPEAHGIVTTVTTNKQQALARGKLDCAAISSQETSDAGESVEVGPAANVYKIHEGEPKVVTGVSHGQGFRYQLVTEAQSWESAKAVCKTKGGYLTDILDAGEVEAIKKTMLLAGSTVTYDQVWIGANDLKKEGTWVWDHSGAELQYTDWYAGEPNNGGRENCATILPKRDMKWNDMVCDQKLPFICKVGDAVLSETSSTNQAAAADQAAAEAYCNSLGSTWSIGYTDAGGGSLYCLKDGTTSDSNCDSCDTYRIVVWKDGGGETKHDTTSYPFNTIAGNVYSAHTTPCSYTPDSLGSPCDQFGHQNYCSNLPAVDICEETETFCEASFRTDRSTCNEFCEDHGLACIEGWDEDGTDLSCSLKLTNDDRRVGNGCGMQYGTQICKCGGGGDNEIGNSVDPNCFAGIPPTVQTVYATATATATTSTAYLECAARFVGTASGGGGNATNPLTIGVSAKQPADALGRSMADPANDADGVYTYQAGTGLLRASTNNGDNGGDGNTSALLRGSPYAAGDVVTVVLDLSANTVSFGLNGACQGEPFATLPDPPSGTPYTWKAGISIATSHADAVELLQCTNVRPTTPACVYPSDETTASSTASNHVSDNGAMLPAPKALHPSTRLFVCLFVWIGRSRNFHFGRPSTSHAV